MTWKTIELGTCVAEMRGGASIKGDEFTESGYPVLHKGTIREGGHLVFERDGKSHVPLEYADAKSKAIVDSNFVVATLRNLVRTGETLGFMAPVPNGESYLLAQGAYGVRLDGTKLDERYLSHLSNAWIFHKEVLRRMVGSTQVHIRNSQFLQVPIPLPPLAEQKRIAGILDAADALRAKRREALAQLDTLLQSTFLDMFGDPVTNLMEWEVSTLGAVSHKITDGTHKTPRYTEVGIEFLSAKDLKENGVCWGTGKFISEQEHSQLIKRCNPELGDILLAKSGTLGSVAVIDRAHDFSLFESLCLIKHDRSRLGASFLCTMIATQSMQRLLLRKNKGVAVKHLHLVDIRSLEVLLPPLGEQRRFADIADAIELQKGRMRDHLTELDALFASLQSRAFNGEL